MYKCLRIANNSRLKVLEAIPHDIEAHVLANLSDYSLELYVQESEVCYALRAPLN